MRGVLQQVVDVVGPEKAKRRYENDCVTGAKYNHIKRSTHVNKLDFTVASIPHMTASVV